MSDTATATLADFLRTQLDIEEDGRARSLRDLAEAMRATGHDATADFLAREADRVLADCEAKRRIVQRVKSGPTGSEPWDDGWYCAMEEVMEALALPYADHPGYREEWRP